MLELFPDYFKFFNLEVHMLYKLHNLLKFRIDLHFSGTLLDYGTAKYDLKFWRCTQPTSKITPFFWSPWTSEALVEIVEL